MSLANRLVDAWYKSSWWLWLLWPLSLLYWAMFTLLRFTAGPIKANPIPLLVVGNITLGGTGKTPVVQALVEELKQRGIHCGIISRGYGGSVGKGPLMLNQYSSVAEVGDEPLMLYKACDVPVVVGSDRHAAMEKLTANYQLNMIISDDGLQNRHLQGDANWLVIDGQRGLGNGQCLPMGPLREPAHRASQVDNVFITGGREASDVTAYTGDVPVYRLQPHLDSLHRLAGGKEVDWPSTTSTVHGLAGIGNPQRFFTDLKALGYQVECHGFADHHVFTRENLAPYIAKTLIMTAKDAVKCTQLLSEFSEAQENWYFVKQRVEIPDIVVDQLLDQFQLSR